MAADSKARQEHFGRVLAEMNNKLAALRSQIASLEQEQASRPLHESPSTDRRASPVSEPNRPNTAPHASQAGQPVSPAVTE
ncbi:MAG: hypothetical protein ACT4QB_01985 [Gammaproteobacteria bacterium]